MSSPVNSLVKLSMPEPRKGLWNPQRQHRADRRDVHFQVGPHGSVWLVLGFDVVFFTSSARSMFRFPNSDILLPFWTRCGSAHTLSRKVTDHENILAANFRSLVPCWRSCPSVVPWTISNSPPNGDVAACNNWLLGLAEDCIPILTSSPSLETRGAPFILNSGGFRLLSRIEVYLLLLEHTRSAQRGYLPELVSES